MTASEALHIAHADAERAYHDLSAYRVLVSLEEDGWHVEYELNNPRLNGGGPNYIIDPVSGEIVSKVYNQ
jgi:hypothetical protein